MLSWLYVYMYYTVTDELKAVSDELNQRENEYVGEDILSYMLQTDLQPSACFKAGQRVNGCRCTHIIELECMSTLLLRDAIMCLTMFTGFAGMRPLTHFSQNAFLPVPREVLVEWSIQSSGCGQLNLLCVESDFIVSVSCNVAAKSVMVLENKRIQQLNLASGWQVSYS